MTALTLLSDYFKTETDRRFSRGGDGYRYLKKGARYGRQNERAAGHRRKKTSGNAGKTKRSMSSAMLKARLAVTFDDEIDTAGSLTNTVVALLERGAKEVYSCATHPVFSDAPLSVLPNVR